VATRAEMMRTTSSPSVSWCVCTTVKNKRVSYRTNGVPSLFPVLDPFHENQAVRVVEHTHRQFERDPMLFLIRFVLGRVPLEPHLIQLYEYCPGSSEKQERSHPHDYPPCGSDHISGPLQSNTIGYSGGAARRHSAAFSGLSQAA